VARWSAVERSLRAEGARLIAGVDEVGRGPLAGPVFACAVVMPPGERAIAGVEDSKRLNAAELDVFLGQDFLITLPNAQVMNQPIVNFSARDERRLDLPVSIAYEDDPMRALEVIRKALDEHPRVLKTREPQLLVQRFGASSVDLAIQPWVRTAEVLQAQSEVLAAIKLALEAANITIPSAQQVMRFVGEAPPALPPAPSGDGGSGSRPAAR